MGNKSAWKEKAEKEIYKLLAKTFGKNNIQRDPKVNGKKADFLVKPIGTYIEVYTVRDVTSDIIKETRYSSHVVYVDIPKEKVLDRLAGKIQHECEQLPKEAPNVLMVKTEELYVSPYDVGDVFMEPSLIINRETMESVEIKYKSHFRAEDETQEVLEKISAIIAYEAACKHEKLCGVLIDNKNNAKIPLNRKKHSLFEEMICDKCK